MATLEQVLEKNPKDVKIVFKNYPLPMHQFALNAALSAMAAHNQGKFWEFHNEIFANISQLSDQKTEEIAKKIGLDMEKFKQDRDNQKTKVAVSRDQQDGAEAGVRGTPTLFINGKLLKGDRSPEGFQQMIDQELAKLRGGKK